MTKITQEEFIKRLNRLYQSGYSFNEAEYKGYYAPIKIICEKHGVQYRTPAELYRGSICKECSHERRSVSQRLTTDEFIKKANIVHNYKYIYLHTHYIDAKHDVNITCPIHGDFHRNANSHLNGRGCPKCSKQRFTYMTNEEREQCFRDVHGNKYSYNWSTYTKAHNPMEMMCAKHGAFWQTPSKHLTGEQCPKCYYSKLEEEIEQLLKSNNIKYIWQYKNIWLGIQSLDFYLPDYNIAIECQGLQHFKPVKLYGGDKGFVHRKQLDEIKRAKCCKKGVKLLYYSNLHIVYPYKVYEDKNELLNEILKGENN